MKRLYAQALAEALSEYRQMLFVSGPRQVGKTTLARDLLSSDQDRYYNWDNIGHRQLILSGVDKVAMQTGLDQLHSQPPVLAFDELHKYKDWKNWLKGFFDQYEKQAHILVTSSARMDIFRKGGDSLMGRYFHYRMHPLSMRELAAGFDSSLELQHVRQPGKGALTQLLKFGGFPEPFLQANTRFSNRWQKLRQQQLIYDDIRDASQVQEIAQLEILAQLLAQQSGQVTRYSTLAKQIRVSVDTIRRWLVVLESFYYCYHVRPWFKNITTALRKEPKTYLWDWSQLTDKGARNENFVASHLLKAVHWWTDRGLGQYDLHYLRTKDQKEVDFLVSKNGKPWFLVEVKSTANHAINKHLGWFQKKTGAQHAFQLAMDLPYVEADCFAAEKPTKIPVENLLMRLV